MKHWTLVLILILSTASFAEPQSSLNSLSGDKNTAPIQEQSNDVPGDKVIPPIDNGRIDSTILKAKETWKAEQERLQTQNEEGLEEGNSTSKEQGIPQEFEKTVPLRSLAFPTTKPRKSTLIPKVVNFSKPSGHSITIFKSNSHWLEEEMITLPSGAHAFGRVKFGEEVTANSKSEVMVELDYAFLGPNKSVVELNGCIVWVNVDSNFQVQKIKGSMQDMTCTMSSGRVFTIAVGGPLVEMASGYAGVESDLIMKGPAKAAALKFLGEITHAYGAATAAAQTKTEVVSGDKFSDKATNVAGDKNAFIQGKVVEAHGDFLKYISSFFETLQPTLALAPGTKVHLINRFNVKIPKVFFKKGESNG